MGVPARSSHLPRRGLAWQKAAAVTPGSADDVGQRWLPPRPSPRPRAGCPAGKKPLVYTWHGLGMAARWRFGSAGRFPAQPQEENKASPAGEGVRSSRPPSPGLQRLLPAPLPGSPELRNPSTSALAWVHPHTRTQTGEGLRADLPHRFHDTQRGSLSKSAQKLLKNVISDCSFHWD